MQPVRAQTRPAQWVFGTGKERWVRLERGNPPFSRMGKPWLGKIAGQIVNGQLFTTVRMSSDLASLKLRIVRKMMTEISVIFEI